MMMMIMMVLLFLSIPAFVALIKVSKAMQDRSRNIRDNIYTINRDFTTATGILQRKHMPSHQSMNIYNHKIHNYARIRGGVCRGWDTAAPAVSDALPAAVQVSLPGGVPPDLRAGDSAAILHGGSQGGLQVIIQSTTCVKFRW